MKHLDARTAVVIGGGSGIGRGIADGLAAEGMSVVVADIDVDAARSVVDEIAKTGGSAEAAPVDGTSRESLTELRDDVVDRHGSVALLSNNVGIVLDRPLDEATEADWGWVIEFNLLSIVRGVDVFLPAVRAAGGDAHIVNTASMAGVLALPPQFVGGVALGLYTTTKHAVLAYTEMLRGELAPEDIGVSVLCPGLVESNLSTTTARNRPDRYGGSFENPREGGMPPGAMDPLEVGPIVANGVKHNRLHIFTHAVGERTAVEARQAAMLDDFDFFATP